MKYDDFIVGEHLKQKPSYYRRRNYPICNNFSYPQYMHIDKKYNK